MNLYGKGFCASAGSGSVPEPDGLRRQRQRKRRRLRRLKENRLINILGRNRRLAFLFRIVLCGVDRRNENPANRAAVGVYFLCNITVKKI